MKFSFHPAAAEEFSAAVDWYEMRQPGLGVDFAVEVRAAVGRAMALPNAWVELEPGIRRVLTQRFPFGVLYSPANSSVLVLAVMHLSRQPDYWKARLAPDSEA